MTIGSNSRYQATVLTKPNQAFREIDSLQAGRGFAALSVLLFHTEITLALPKYLGTDVFPIFTAGNSGVDYFFVLSGFVILLAHFSDINRPEMTTLFLWKRFRRVYLPLWFTLIFVIPVFFVFPSFGKGPERELGTIAQAIIISPSKQDFILAPEWTLRHEVTFYALFLILIWKQKAGLLLFFVFGLFALVEPFTHFGYPMSFFFSPYNILFGFGMIAFLVFRKGVRTGQATALSLGILLFACTWAVRVYLGTDSYLASWSFGLAAALIIFGAASLERDRGIDVPRHFKFLGQASYSIYLVHFPVISFSCKMVSICAHRTHIPHVLWFFVVSLLALAAGMIFHVLIEKPVLKRVSAVRLFRRATHR